MLAFKASCSPLNSTSVTVYFMESLSSSLLSYNLFKTALLVQLVRMASSVILLQLSLICIGFLFKILVSVYKSLNAYLSDLLIYRWSSYSLRSVSSGDFVEPS